MFIVYCKPWIYFDGNKSTTVPYGFSLHKTIDDYDQYIKEYYDSLKKIRPDYYHFSRALPDFMETLRAVGIEQEDVYYRLLNLPENKLGILVPNSLDRPPYIGSLAAGSVYLLKHFQNYPDDVC